MTEELADDPFHDCELDPDAVLGTQTFEDVLFTDDTETPVNVLTGQTPAHSKATVEEAKAFAASIDTDVDAIEKRITAAGYRIESPTETQCRRGRPGSHAAPDWSVSPSRRSRVSHSPHPERARREG